MERLFDVLGAQKIILGELRKEFGGAAGDFIGRAFDAAAKAMQLDFMGKDGADGAPGRDGIDGKSITVADVMPELEAHFAKWAIEVERRAVDVGLVIQDAALHSFGGFFWGHTASG